MSNPLGLGLIGLGTVGTGVVQLLREAPAAVRRRKASFEVRRVGVRDPSKSRDVDLPRGVLTGDAGRVISDPEVQVVVELTGAPEAFDWIRQALQAGKHVVTANKAMIGDPWRRVVRRWQAEQAGVGLCSTRPAVAGGIPIVKASLRERTCRGQSRWRAVSTAS